MKKRLRKRIYEVSDVFASPAFETAPKDRSSRVRCIEGFRSAILPSGHDLWVYVPPLYGSDPEKRYPVLYLQDGQNLFLDEASSAGRSWRLQSAADEAIASGGAEPMIIVGIQSTGHRRVREYTPTPDRKHPTAGGAESYVHFLVDEVKPRLDALLHTDAGRSATGIGGSSLGALLSLWAALRWPHVFSRVAAISPAVWWDDRMIVREVAALPSRPDMKVWLDIGTAEGEATIAATRALHEAMVARGWRERDDLRFTEIDRGRHFESDWGSRMQAVLAFLFPAA